MYLFKTNRKELTMGFTTSCFIRKNTPELRNRLKKLGIRPFLCNEELNAIGANIKAHNGMVAAFTCSDSLNNCDDLIDCGTNEDLFLAIAALRDDTDDNQLFINDKGDWGIWRDNTKYDGLSGIDFYGMPNDLNVDNYHKATTEELIEHFKGKE